MFERSASTGCSTLPESQARQCKSSKIHEAKFDWHSSPEQWSPCTQQSRQLAHGDMEGLSQAISDFECDTDHSKK